MHLLQPRWNTPSHDNHEKINSCTYLDELTYLPRFKTNVSMQLLFSTLNLFFGDALLAVAIAVEVCKISVLLEEKHHP